MILQNKVIVIVIVLYSIILKYLAISYFILFSILNNNDSNSNSNSISNAPFIAIISNKTKQPGNQANPET